MDIRAKRGVVYPSEARRLFDRAKRGVFLTELSEAAMRMCEARERPSEAREQIGGFGGRCKPPNANGVQGQRPGKF